MCNGCCDPDRCQACGTGRSIKPKPHKHAEVIKAWADGHKIQLMTPQGVWCDIEDTVQPSWLEFCEYRVKPKSDSYSYVGLNSHNTGAQWVSPTKIASQFNNHVKLTWDGETGKLKDVEIIK